MKNVLWIVLVVAGVVGGFYAGAARKPAQQQPVTQAPAPLPTPEEWKNRDQAPKPAAEQ